MLWSVLGSRVLTLVHANITIWGPQSESYLCSGEIDAEGYMVYESHLSAEKFMAVAPRLTRAGWASFHSSAIGTGRSQHGTHGGEMILAKRRLHATPVDHGIVASASLGHSTDTLRWAACFLRLRHVTILLVELYLWTGVGLTADENLLVLHQVAMLTQLVNCPVIVAGDWQCPPEELVALGWPSRTRLSVCRPTNVDWTCTNGIGSLITSLSHRACSLVLSLWLPLLMPHGHPICL